jgi:hypothetical protein
LAPVPSALAEPSRDQRLRLELDSLRASRAALAAGRPLQALSVLDSYAGGFQLLPVEAGIVRAQALRNAGDENGSRMIATELLSRHGSGPYAARLRELLGE